MSPRNHIILLVDDDQNDRILIRRSLKKMSLENPVFEAVDGRQAIAYLAGEPPFSDREKYPFPGILFLDLKMPGADGFEVLEWLRAELPTAHLLVIVLSHIDDIRQVNRAYSLGANSFLTKPGTPEELNELVASFPSYWTVREPSPNRGSPVGYSKS